VAENPRIEELRRRVHKDPASIAFAQLAEEFRRMGNYEEAIDICRIGLQTHPSYLSARVTLGRALVEQNDLENAEAELRYVLHHAPENLSAIRAMAEIHHRRGQLPEALVFYKSALELARHDPDLEQTVDEISRAVSKGPAPVPVPVPAVTAAMTAEQATADFLRNTFDLVDFDAIEPDPEPEPVVAAPDPVMAAPEPVMPPPELVIEVPKPVMVAAEPEPEPELILDAVQLEALQDDFAPMDMGVITNPALPGLERFLEAIHSYRQRRAI
jgi:tetratricopeptide (TPR) repeat protein